MEFWVIWGEISKVMAALCLVTALAAAVSAAILLLREKLITRLSGEWAKESGRRTIILTAVAALIWLIPLQSRFSYGFWALHKAAVSFAIVHLPTTGIALLVLLAAAALIALAPILGLVLPGLMVTIQCFFIEKVLKEYMDDEEAQTDD